MHIQYVVEQKEQQKEFKTLYNNHVMIVSTHILYNVEKENEKNFDILILLSVVFLIIRFFSFFKYIY